MSSTNKTTNLKLNKWIGTDRSAREDFNNDNDLIDKFAGEVTASLKDVAHKNGAIQINLNSEKISGKTVNDLVRYEGVIPSNANLNEYRTIGTKYRIVDSTNIINYSPKENNSELIIHGDTESALVQIVYASTGKMFIRSYQSWRINNWSEWKQIATTESTEITNFQNGWVKYPDASYGTGLTKVGDLINLSILVANNTPITGTTIFTLPSGFIPKKAIIFTGNTGDSIFEARIYNDGRVVYNSGGLAKDNYLNLQVTYSL